MLPSDAPPMKNAGTPQGERSDKTWKIEALDGGLGHRRILALGQIFTNEAESVGGKRTDLVLHRFHQGTAGEVAVVE